MSTKCIMIDMTVRQTICGECPFRRKAAPGWLGANAPEEFAEMAVSDNSIGCHTQVNQSLPKGEWQVAEANAPRCRGAMTMMRNMCKLPRHPATAALQRTVPADRDEVFSHPSEFVEFHNAARVKSWTFERKEK